MNGQVIAYVAGAVVATAGWIAIGIVGRKAWDRSTGRTHGRSGR